MVRLSLICLLVALVIAGGIAFLRPLADETDPLSPASDAGRNAETQPAWIAAEPSSDSLRSKSPEPEAPAASLRAASVKLPQVPTPGTAESFEAEARQVADELRSRYPDSAEAIHVAAMLHAQLRETEQAEALWQQALDRAPNDERYSVNLAAVAMDRGDYPLAVKTLRKLIDRGNTSADVLHHFGLALSNLGETEEAEAVLEQAVAIYPQSAAHWMVLGQTQLKRGSVEEAEASLQKALERGADSADLYFHLANAHRRLGHQEQAAEYQKRFQELKESDPIAADQRFQILSAGEARNTAAAIMVEAAAVHAQREDTVRAEVSLLRALAIEPRSIAACRSLADLYQKEQALAEEHVVRERLTELEPFRFENHLALAQVSSQLGRWEEAEASLKLALAQQPKAAIGYVALAEFYYQARMAGKARWFAQEAARRFPSPEGYRFLAETCRLGGDEASAAEALKMAERLQVGRSDSPDRSPVPSEP